MRLDKELYADIHIGYIVKQLKLWVNWKFPVTKLMTLFLYSCLHGTSCVMGDVESWIHSYLPESGEHSVEGYDKGIGATTCGLDFGEAISV